MATIRMPPKTVPEAAVTPTCPVRLGLCCQFAEQPIRFRTTTAAALLKLSRERQLEKLAEICRDNAMALHQALEYCAAHGIGSFRVNSQILPLATHPLAGYRLEALPGGDAIRRLFQRCGRFAARQRLRTTFHPDQFVVLNSPRPEVVEASLAELEYQAEVAVWIGADVINIHAGGAYGDKPAALEAFRRNLQRVSPRVRKRLTLENDDKLYTPRDLLSLCRAEGIPLVYDVHHHRCHGDGLPIAEATQAALATWEREPLFHLSSPRNSWLGESPRLHHDYIDPSDFPADWLAMRLTVEVEAKAKELAVERLRQHLALASGLAHAPHNC